MANAAGINLALLVCRHLSKQTEGFYDAQAVYLDDGCRVALRIYGDAVRARAHRSSDRSFLLPEFGDVEAWEPVCRRLS
jgi:hypothetical protein